MWIQGSTCWCAHRGGKLNPTMITIPHWHRSPDASIFIACRPGSEFIKGYLGCRHSLATQPFSCGLDHRRRTAHVVLQTSRIGVMFEILLVKHAVNEAGHTRPIVLPLRLGQREMKAEVGPAMRHLLEVFPIEHLQ